MFESSFKKNKLKEEVVAVFDIGSASIGGALVLLQKNEKPKILYSVRKQMKTQDGLDLKSQIQNMTRFLKKVLENLEKKGLVHLNFLSVKNKEISRGFCFFASPWSISHVKSIKIKKEKKFFVTQELLDSIIETKEENLVGVERDSYKKILGEEIEVMDKKIIQIKLNDYLVDNPFDKKVKNIEATIFMSFVSKEVSDKVKKVVESFFHLDKLFVSSFTLPYFLSLRDTFSFEKDFIFLDVGGEITDVSFVKNDALRGTQTFSFGRNNFIKEVMEKMSVNYGGAVSLMKADAENKLNKEASLKLNESLHSVKKEWVGLLEKGMLNLSQGAILPRTVFLVSEDDLGSFLQKIIKEEKFSELVFPDYNETSKQIVIETKELSKYLVFCKKFDDIFLAIETFFIDKISEKSK